MSFGAWSRGPPLHYFHFFPTAWKISICHEPLTVDVPRVETSSGMPDGACNYCQRLLIAEQTPEARLIHESTGLLWSQADDPLRKLATHCAEQNSLLAIELTRARQRVDALYTGERIT